MLLLKASGAKGTSLLARPTTREGGEKGPGKKEEKELKGLHYR
jgi:hypothetical protein